MGSAGYPLAMRVIDCEEQHAGAIQSIFNDVIATATAIYEYQPRSAETVRAWFESKRQGGYPVLGAISDADELMGFASYGPFRPWPAYKYTVEHSLHVAEPFRGRGVGRRLLEELITRAKAQDYHTMIGGIDSRNTASIRLHVSLGFRCVGTLPQVGFKFDRWLDLCLYQLILDTPAKPVDG